MHYVFNSRMLNSSGYLPQSEALPVGQFSSKALCLLDLPADLDIANGVPLYPSWKAIVQRDSHDSRSLAKPSQPGPSYFLQLLKIIITLSVNNHLSPVQDDNLQDLVQMLQEVDPLAHFVALIAKFELYSIIQTILNLRTIVTEIFAGRLLPHAVELGDTRLIRLLLQTRCSLTATKRIKTGSFTSLEIAVLLQRDMAHVTLLLEARNDPIHSARFDDLLHVMKSIPRSWCGTMSATEHAILERLLDAKIVEETAEATTSSYTGVVLESLRRDKLEVCHVVFKRLTVLVDEKCREQCAVFVNAVMNDDAENLRYLLAERKDWQETFRRDSINQDIFHCLLSIALFKGNQEMWCVFERLGPSLTSAFGSYVNWLAWLHSYLVSGEGKTSRFLQVFGAYLDGLSLTYILKKALGRGWLDVLQLPICQQGEMHYHNLENGSVARRRCWVQSANVRRELLDDPEMVDFLICASSQNYRDAALCCLEAVTLTGSATLLHRILEGFETFEPSSNCSGIATVNAYQLLEEASVLLYALGLESSGVLLCLLEFGISLDNLNRYLGGDLGTIIQDARMAFSQPSSVLELALAKGLYPSCGLLILCAVSGCTESIENMSLVVETARARNTPFSRDDLTHCINVVLRGLLDQRSPPPIESLKHLVNLGAIVEDPFHRYTLQSKAPDADYLLQESIMSGLKPTYLAIRDGDMALLERLFEDGLDDDKYHWTYGEYMTPLQYASLCGEASAVSLLLQRGADANKAAYHVSGLTALQAAAINGHFQIVVKLLQLGADINAPAATFWGRTALEGAAEWGRLDLVQFLISNNSDELTLRKDCKRASRFAAYNNHNVLARMLTEHARKLAEQLKVSHEDEIDQLCECDIERWLNIPCYACGRKDNIPIEEYWVYG